MKNTESDVQIFGGTISVKALLESGKREVVEVWIDKTKRSKDLGWIMGLCQKLNVPVLKQEHTLMQETLEGCGGVIAYAKHRVLPMLEDSTELRGFCVFIDGVEDPYNMGSICRSLYAAGANALLIRKRDWCMSENTLLKASAGSWERMPVFMIENDEALASWKKASGMPILASSRKNAISLFNTNFPLNCLVVIGGALRGISAAVETLCDQNFYIPYGRDFKNALDTASCAAVVGFAWTRQMLQEQADPMDLMAAPLEEIEE